MHRCCLWYWLTPNPFRSLASLHICDACWMNDTENGRPVYAAYSIQFLGSRCSNTTTIWFAHTFMWTFAATMCVNLAEAHCELAMRSYSTIAIGVYAQFVPRHNMSTGAKLWHRIKLTAHCNLCVICTMCWHCYNCPGATLPTNISNKIQTTPIIIWIHKIHTFLL